MDSDDDYEVYGIKHISDSNAIVSVKKIISLGR